MDVSLLGRIALVHAADEDTCPAPWPVAPPSRRHRRPRACEKRFGDIVIPSRLTAGWWHGTPRYDPFFEAEIRAAEPVTRIPV